MHQFTPSTVQKMWDKPIEAITIKVYPLTLAGFILVGSLTVGSLGIWWTQLYPGSSLDHGESVQAPLQASPFLPDPSDRSVWSIEVLEPSPLPPVSRNPSTVAFAPDLSPTAETETSIVEPIATLRVGNQTPHPVRIAFLQRPETESDRPSDEVPISDAPIPDAPISAETLPDTIVDLAANPLHPEPVHWDFEPGEGGYQGLILSLPQGDLNLEVGDILVAFAQDGSRRYWGPYVVGETPLPYWNQQRSEWQLLLQP